MLVKTFGSALHGVEAFPITIEVSVSKGFHHYMVGLPDNAVKESLQRLEIAIRSIEREMPRNRIVINLAPADIKKSGTGFDLPMAIGVLGASGQLLYPERLADYVIMGELGLDGSLLPVKGALPMAIRARTDKFKGIIVPRQNEKEAGMVNDLKVYGMDHLKEVVEFFNTGSTVAEPVVINTRQDFYNTLYDFEEDFADVKGQENMKRVMEIAASGGHNVLLIGPPGSSKTMLSKRLHTILPPLNLQEALETTRIYSVAGLLGEKRDGLISTRPFRVPHHTISNVALVGGGSTPQPGEISLAHNGVLFLDELPEFKRSVLEVLRQPMEERRVIISRAKRTLEFPSGFMLIASMNPCPCGYFNHPEKKCTCSPSTVQKYMGKISGPLLDRIDLQVNVTPVPFYELDKESNSETSDIVRERVIRARAIQAERNQSIAGVSTNARLNSKQVQKICVLDQEGKNLLYSSMQSMQLSARAYERILKVSRTIADMGASEKIELKHVAEAIHYRSLDKMLYKSSAEEKSNIRSIHAFSPTKPLSYEAIQQERYS